MDSNKKDNLTDLAENLPKPTPPPPQTPKPLGPNQVLSPNGEVVNLGNKLDTIKK